MDLASIPYEQLLTTFKPVAMFLVLYCFLFVTIGRIFGNERRARMLVSVIIAIYATNSILANGWDTLIATSVSGAVGAIVKLLLGNLSKFHKNPVQQAGE